MLIDQQYRYWTKKNGIEFQSGKMINDKEITELFGSARLVIECDIVCMSSIPIECVLNIGF